MNELTASDVALLNRDNDGFGNGWGGMIWLFAIIALMGGGFGGWGNGAGYMANYATQADIVNGFNAQTLQDQNRGLAEQIQTALLTSANSNYETARLISEQTNSLLQQNNVNMINSVQSLNQVLNSINMTSAQTHAQIADLSHQMQQCCCEMKQQMLTDRLADKTADLAVARSFINNSEQSAYLLGQMGKWIANPSST